ncbi:MAG: helix-turn-helix domain-containing protein [Candidatus Pacebacteria bacterium]|nr:helix-turn-helix domain-containing protein [Candidatus Paceibacterota bacterium]PIR59732.1 MAG: transcriptional regulator [Candidatus Pacebacteria bacterium CG10_big_fil_rev_8_21_14_0_10_45_6]
MPKTSKEKQYFRPWEELKNEFLSDPECKAEYDKLEAEYELISELIGKRLQRGLSQKQLAEKVGTKQSAISRLESGEGNPSFKFLKRVAEGLDSKLKISFT